MKKILICALNAKYIHSSLAIRYLKAYANSIYDLDIQLAEYTINDYTRNIMADIYRIQPDILCFSSYIWNIEQILELCEDYKKVSPESIIVLGGPEVSYDAETLLSSNSCLDYIIRGEGEESFSELMKALNDNKAIGDIKGISYRKQDFIISNHDREPIARLDMIPFPYEGELNQLADRIVYYESSRGCPFNCSYCLSSTIKGVRYFSLDRVKEDLHKLLQYQVREIKFVDRTFNCNEERTIEIIRFIMEHNFNTKIHLEIQAQILSEGLLSFLSTVPPEIFNLEIGIQSTCQRALEAVNRNQNWDKLSAKILKLKSFNNFHLHLDLIAGLPYEDYQQFKQSFNMVYKLQPDALQLGFLKLLKGSNIRKESSKHGYIYQSRAPYQIFANSSISYDEILKLHNIEDLLDKYYNSSSFSASIRYIVENIYNSGAFSFFEELSEFWTVQGLFSRAHKKESLYSHLKAFVDFNYPYQQSFLNELLKYDYLSNNQKYSLPKGLISFNSENINEQLYDLIKNESFMKEHLPEMALMSPRETRKKLHLEVFHYNPLSDFHEEGDFAMLFVYDLSSKKAVKHIVTEIKS